MGNISWSQMVIMASFICYDLPDKNSTPSTPTQHKEKIHSPAVVFPWILIKVETPTNCLGNDPQSNTESLDKDRSSSFQSGMLIYFILSHQIQRPWPTHPRSHSRRMQRRVRLTSGGTRRPYKRARAISGGK